MIKRLKVEIRKVESTDKNILWELSTIKDLSLVMFSQNPITVKKQNNNDNKPLYVDIPQYSVEFKTKLNKEKAIQQIASMFMKKEFKAFEVIEIK